MAKQLMTLDPATVAALAGQPGTGMGFQIVETPDGYVAVLQDEELRSRIGIPLYQERQVYYLADALAGEPRFARSTVRPLQVTSVLPSRAAVTSALVAATTIAPGYGGGVGAFPLIKSGTLSSPTIMPLPSSNVFEYEIRKGAELRVGTVAPMFGQSGGGVEVQLQSRHSAKLLRNTPLPDF